MYNINYFKEKDKQSIMDFIEDYPFAFMTGSFLSGMQVATQIPILSEQRNGELYFQGHIMRNTDHHKAFAENPEALLVFSGPNCYVSASWYSNPATASTWNYMSVHVSGQVNFMSDNKFIEFMRKLTLKFENYDTLSPTIYDNLSDQYLSRMLPAIVGFEIKAEQFENVFKLSQNMDKNSYISIISKLLERGGFSALIANEMLKRKNEIFPESET
ncbi:MAG TPA: FMN-binding negative transcriptional regulator [Saprospiraceae bacterium]|nr:FMN-binding negative transcriptional regulator [Saprospiraceae bacterium]HRO08896.1 FMN-binding negative transcriptional regulator [Saprospiraceae bacterium]HRO72555.1 FMN-binding negative transcriptional regulator [Saprospiraceae bacterium]HRP42111.1 FMN-binding negative transcriptional regulator [Saprospiraceae bacterium]